MDTPGLLTDSWTDLEKFFGIGGMSTANTTGMNPAQTKIATGAATISNAGVLAAVFGGVTQAIGGYYAAKTQQYQDRSQASSLTFQSNMDAINASQAELSAQSVEEAGKNQVSQYTMQEGQKVASSQVATAARGVDLTSASAVDQRASDELVKQIDVLTINSNTARAAAAQRVQGTNYSNQALLDQTSANNLRTSANTISPISAGVTSLLGSASSFASQWDYRRRFQLATANGGGFSTPSIGSINNDGDV